MSLSAWWLFVMTETVLSISPGPAVLFVVSQALRGGSSRGISGALGILSANAVWFVLSGLGVGALLLAAGHWVFALRWAAAAYLVYLAVKPIVSQSAFAPQLPDESPSTARPREVWRRGFLLQVANPKALVFFVALLPQFVDPYQPVGPQIVILGVTSVVCEFPVLAAYAALAGWASRWAREPRFARAIDLAAAVLLITAALGVALAPEARGGTP
jgi:homoserine/homoserine lactone efflux protein